MFLQSSRLTTRSFNLSRICSPFLFFLIRCCALLALSISYLICKAATKLGPLTIHGEGNLAELPIGFTSTDGVTCLQFDLDYNASALPLGAATLGEAAPGHKVDSTLVSPGKRRVVLYSTTLAPLDGGIILRFPAPGAVSGAGLPAITGVRLVSPGLSPVALTGTDLRATLLTEPVATTSTEGGRVTLSSAASGFGTLTYQWLFEGEPIAGATGASYTVENLVAANAGHYSVRVSNPAGEVVSAAATLTVQTAAPTITSPDQAFFVLGAAGEHRFTGNQVGQWSAAGLPSWLGLEAGTGWLRGTPPPDGVPVAFTAQARNPAGTATASQSFILLLLAPSGTDFVFSPQEFSEAVVGRTLAGFTFTSATAFEATAEPVGSPYRSGQWSYTRVNPNQAQITLSYPQTTPTSYEGLDLLHRGALTVDGLRYDISSAGVPSGYQLTVANYREVFTPREVAAQASSAGGVAISWRDESWADGYRIYRTSTETPPGAGEAPLNGTALVTSGSYTDTSARQGAAYFYWVTALRYGQETPAVAGARASVTAPVLKPAITQDPVSPAASVDAGLDATFSVAATGEGLSYQWLFKGEIIPGATEPSYRFMALKERAGDYVVRVSNVGGTVQSRPVSLVVRDIPVVLNRPALVSAAVNTTKVIDVTVVGTGLTFQWFFNGKAVKGATREDLSIKVTAATAGDYTLRIKDDNGDTAEALVSVKAVAVPKLTRQPAATATLGLGGGAQFTVAASGEALSYQWFKNGQALGGETGATLTLANATAEMQGKYTVTVSNLAGSVASKGTQVTVLSPPSISRLSGPLTVAVGKPFSLSVTASGPGKLTYQWRLNGSPLPKATAAVYNVKMAATNQAGAYTVVVRNSVGERISDPVLVTVAAP